MRSADFARAVAGSCNIGFNADRRVISKYIMEVMDNNRYGNGFTRSRYAGTEQSLVTLCEPLLEFI